MESQASDELPAAAFDPRLSLILRIEKTGMVTRYIAYLLLVLLFASGASSAQLGELFFVCTIGLLHNACVHWILYSKRYALFLTRTNFLSHLAEITLAVIFTGGAASPLFVLYFLFIIGFATYSRNVRGIVLVTFISAFSYSAIAALHEYSFGLSEPPLLLMVKLLAIIMCGWFMGTLGEFLQNTEIDLEKRAQALASSEATLRTILDSTEEPILVAAENEFITDVNDRACSYLGVPRGELIGQRFRAFLFDDGTLPNKLAALRSRGEYHGETILLKASGDERNVEMHVRSFARDGRRYFVTMWHDITDQKNVQETSRLANLRLKEINRELQRITALRTEFFSLISRRLRSPLNGVHGYCELLLGEELGPLTMEQRRAVDTSRRSVQRVFSLIDELADMPPVQLQTPMETPMPEDAGMAIHEEAAETPGTRVDAAQHTSTSIRHQV
jgi:PAS domain S-box-containing protein